MLVYVRMLDANHVCVDPTNLEMKKVWGCEIKRGEPSRFEATKKHNTAAFQTTLSSVELHWESCKHKVLTWKKNV